MSHIPADLKYTREHEWLRIEGDEAVVGITYHAQDQLGEVVFVDLPRVGESFERDSEFATIESVKAVSEGYMPVSATVIAINQDLEGNPEQVNDDPYGNGWLVRIKIENTSEINALLDAAAYQKFITEE
ncbi:MAG: hypothetical protein RIT27_795 [Pseudomonadota bacterium]|jgi:glycine cleavage system H protein